ncbi:unnamed protein product [Schistosoma rodhaini]|nr:unnamed protein product [Schistosoma rodhaini]
MDIINNQLFNTTSTTKIEKSDQLPCITECKLSIPKLYKAKTTPDWIITVCSEIWTRSLSSLSSSSSTSSSSVKVESNLKEIQNQISGSQLVTYLMNYENKTDRNLICGVWQLLLDENAIEPILPLNNNNNQNFNSIEFYDRDDVYYICKHLKDKRLSIDEAIATTEICSNINQFNIELYNETSVEQISQDIPYEQTHEHIIDLDDHNNYEIDGYHVLIERLYRLAPEALFRKILQKLPSNRTEIELQYVYQELLLLPALSSFSITVRKELCKCLYYEVHDNAYDIIFYQGDLGQSWYIIYHGSVWVYLNDQGYICHLYEGDDFGKLSLITDKPRAASIILAENNCHLLKLNKNDFHRILYNVEANTVHLKNNNNDILILEYIPNIKLLLPYTQNDILHNNNNNNNNNNNDNNENQLNQLNYYNYSIIAGTIENILYYLLENCLTDLNNQLQLINNNNNQLYYSYLYSNIPMNIDETWEIFFLTYTLFTNNNEILLFLYKYLHCNKLLETNNNITNNNDSNKFTQYTINNNRMDNNNDNNNEGINNNDNNNNDNNNDNNINNIDNDNNNINNNNDNNNNHNDNNNNNDINIINNNKDNNNGNNISNNNNDNNNNNVDNNNNDNHNDNNNSNNTNTTTTTNNNNNNDYGYWKFPNNYEYDMIKISRIIILFYIWRYCIGLFKFANQIEINQFLIHLKMALINNHYNKINKINNNENQQHDYILYIDCLNQLIKNNEKLINNKSISIKQSNLLTNFLHFPYNVLRNLPFICNNTTLTTTNNSSSNSSSNNTNNKRIMNKLNKTQFLLSSSSTSNEQHHESFIVTKPDYTSSSISNLLIGYPIHPNTLPLIESQHTITIQIYINEFKKQIQITIPIEANVYQIKQLLLSSQKLIKTNHLDELKLVEVLSNGDWILYHDYDCGIIFSLSPNGRLFLTPEDTIQSLAPLAEQLIVTMNFLQLNDIDRVKPSHPYDSSILRRNKSLHGSIQLLDELTIDELAITLSYCHVQLAICIHPQELLDYVIYGNKSNKPCPHVRTLVKRFSLLHTWTMTQIVTTCHLTKRAIIIRKLIKLAERLISSPLYDLYSSFAIILGLQNSSITRLTNTWERVPNRWRRIFNNTLLPLTDPSKNHRTARLWNNNNNNNNSINNTPRLPFLPLILKDLRFAEDANQTDYHKQQNGIRLINFEKMRLISKSLRTWINCITGYELLHPYYQLINIDINKQYYTSLNNLTVQKLLEVSNETKMFILEHMECIDDPRIITQLSLRLEPKK